MSVSMKVDMSGSADAILGRLTDAQITEGIKRAEVQIATLEASLSGSEPWEYHDGPFPPGRAHDHLVAADEHRLRLYQSARNDLLREQQRRAD